MSSNKDEKKIQDSQESKNQNITFCNNVKIQNKGQNKESNINNNVEDTNNRTFLAPERTNALSNGVHSLDLHCSDSNTSDQLKYKSTLHTTSNKNLNACSMGANSASNQVCSSVPQNSMSDNLTRSSVPMFSQPTPSCSLNSLMSAEDTDLRNNVDCATRIEKCPPKVSCSSDSSQDEDRASSEISNPDLCTDMTCFLGIYMHKVCKLNASYDSTEDPGAGPSGLSRRLSEHRDSSSGNEGDMSDNEDHCIYTYKGSDDSIMAQRVNEAQIQENGEVEEHQSGRSSPEMDFLEMDFDPGPSCEQDTGDSDLASINEDIQNIAMDSVEAEQVSLNDLSGGKVVSRQSVSQSSSNSPNSDRNVTSNQNDSQETNETPSFSANSIPEDVFSYYCKLSSSNCKYCQCFASYIRHSSRATASSPVCPLLQSFGYHSTSGDLISPGDNRDTDSELWAENLSASTHESSSLNSCKINLSSNLYHRMMAKKLMLDKQAAFNQSRDSNLENEICDEKLNVLLSIEKVMLWTEQEAIAKQVTQIATSACGTTAAINALYALKVPFALEVLMKGVATRLRDIGAPLPQYLVSRSMAGATHIDIARGISLATNGAVITKFFSFYPERKVSLSHWLHYWISRNAVPIATLNLQHCGVGHDIPDAWHHQMIFGVSQAGIYLTNPLQCVTEKILWHQLVSPSILLVRRADVLAHWNSTTDLTPLMHMNYKWRKMNVLGQVVNIVREVMHGDATPGATHIRIPASYKAGVTLVMHKNSPAASELLCADQLPLL